MNTVSEQWSFFDLRELLTELGSAVGAAEGHGLLCGLVCGGRPDALAAWRLELCGETALAGLDQERLGEVAGFVERELGDPLCAFSPWLPNEGSALTQRVDALAEWCQGFVSGIGLAGTASYLHDDVGEAIADLREISQAGVAPEDCDEQGEAAYAELVEYIRAAVLLIHAHCASGGVEGDGPSYH